MLAPECSHFYFIFRSCTTHPSQHYYLCYTHFMHMLFSSWSIFCSIGHIGLIIVLYNFSFNLIGVRWSQSTPNASHFNRPTFILCLKSLLSSPSSLNIEPRYRNEFLCGVSRVSILVVSTLCSMLLRLQFIYCLCTMYFKAPNLLPSLNFYFYFYLNMTRRLFHFFSVQM